MLAQEEEDETSSINTFKPAFVLVAIDTHSSMFDLREDSEGNKSHCFKDALYACYQLADSLIFASSQRNYNQFGVVLVEDDPKKATLVEIEANLLESIKVLKKAYEKSDSDLTSEYSRAANVDLGAFFLMCKKKFNQIDAAYYKRTIIFVTNDDNPVGDTLKFTAMNEAKTLEASEVNLELITMRKDFDYNKFWNELFNLYTNPPKIDEFCENRDGLLERLTRAIVFRYTSIKCKLFPFKNDFTKHIQCRKVNFIRAAKLYNTNKASKDGKVLMRTRQEGAVSAPRFRVNLGCKSQLEEFDLKEKYEVYGNNLALGLHLQYVSDRQTDVGVMVGSPFLLMVDGKEELSHYFDNFWSYCVDNSKVLVCLKKLKHPTAIRYVELIPKFANNQKLFLVKNLPFVEEIQLPNVLTERPRSNIDLPTEEQTRAVQSLIEKLTFNYEPSMLPNPSYSKKKAYVKAKLLDTSYEEPEDCTDDLSEMYEDIRNDLGNVKQLFDFESGTGGKRKTSSLSKTLTKRGRK